MSFCAGADPGILKGGAPIMKSDNEVRNGRVHRKRMGAEWGNVPLSREARTLFCCCTSAEIISLTSAI